jgi:hypothetical protein
MWSKHTPSSSTSTTPSPSTASSTKSLSSPHPTQSSPTVPPFPCRHCHFQMLAQTLRLTPGQSSSKDRIGMPRQAQQGADDRRCLCFGGAVEEILPRRLSQFRSTPPFRQGKKLRCNLDQSAELIAIPRKTLEDYYWLLRTGRAL